MKTSIKDIANAVGKSVSTVSKALNNSDDISFETKVRVRQTASQMGYMPSVVAQRLKKRRTDTLGLILPCIGSQYSDPIFSVLLAGIDNYSSRSGFDLIVSTCSDGNYELDAYRNKIQGKKVDGFIIINTRVNDERIEFLRNKNFPFIAFGRTETSMDFPYVDIDNVYGMKLVVDYLLKLGHSRLAVITPPNNLVFAKSRLDGIQSTLNRVGLKLSKDFILEGDLTERSGFIQTLILLGQPDPPTAIIVCNDLMAIGAMNAASSKGLKVGSDVSITGFGDIPMAEYSFPPLTTLHQPTFKIGELLSEMLINKINGEEAPNKEIILQPSLIIRQSCGKSVKKISKL